MPAFFWYFCYQQLSNIDHKCFKNRALGSWGPCWHQGRTKVEKMINFDLPPATLLGAFSAPFSLCDALGTLKWRFLGGLRFDITFLIKFWSKTEAFGRPKTLIIRCRGCKNHVFGYVRFFIILGTILEVILEPKMHPKSQFDSLRAPSVTISTLIWGGGKNNEKSGPSRVWETRHGGMRTCNAARW